MERLPLRKLGEQFSAFVDRVKPAKAAETKD